MRRLLVTVLLLAALFLASLGLAYCRIRLGVPIWITMPTAVLLGFVAGRWVMLRVWLTRY